MKRILCIMMTAVLAFTASAPLEAIAQIIQPIAEYTFENENESCKLFGNAQIENDAVRESNVLTLDGSFGSYAELPKGILDGLDKMTITMDVKSEMMDNNFFTFTYGLDRWKYAFLRLRACENMFKIANGTSNTEAKPEEKEIFSLTNRPSRWESIAIVADGDDYYMYVNGIKQGENLNTGITTSDIGELLTVYLGKSFYSADVYFKGSYDNIKIYDQALTADQVLEAVEDTVPLIPSAIVGTVADKYSVGTDYHTASNTIVNNDDKTITPYVRKSADLSALPIKITFPSDECEALIDGEPFVNGSEYDLTYDRTLTVIYKSRTVTYALKKAQIAYNSVLPGKYADPDIDYIDGKYWMFPTTDGFTWWTGYEVHAFSSPDLVNWKDEGVVLNLKDDNPGKNINGVQIAACDWADGSSWAPSIEAKNGKCYLYFCGHDIRPEGNNAMAIGVAVADNPAGPYTAKSTPIVSEEIVGTVIENYGERADTIDPAIFTDDDGKSYLLFGNMIPIISELNKDMTSIIPSSITQLQGLNDFLESLYVCKRGGKYHFTWSCYGTNYETYAVKYGTADNLNGKVDYQYTLLSEKTDDGILCTGHQSTLYMKDLDRCFIAYHRFCTPLEEYTEGYGFHRECCIDEIQFDENGLMKVVTPTMTGTGKVTTKPCSDLNVTLSNYTYMYDGKAKKPSVTVKDKNGKKISTSIYTVSYSDNVNVGNATVTVKFKNPYAGTVKKTFRITPKVVLSQTSFIYDGKEHKPSVTVSDQNGRLSSMWYYDVSYSSGLKNIGTYTVTVKMKKKYNDVIKCTFKINPQISLSATSYTYNGKVRKPTVTVKNANGIKLSTKYYTVSYSSGCKNIGAYTVTVKFRNGHSGTYTKTFKINPKISLSATSYTYNGKVRKPTVTVKNANGTKLSTKYYTVSYSSGCKNVGAYSVTVKFRNGHSGTYTKTFKINPKPTSISKLTAGKKKFTVKWNKQASQTTGYQIQYSTRSDFKGAATVYGGAANTTSKTITGRAAGKKYYVRVRTYKTFNNSGKTTRFYSSWSKAKAIKTY